MRADFTTQWRNRRSVMMSLLVPLIILISWKGLIDKFGGAFVFSISLTIGLVSIGMMGYAISVARDRDKGIFQRLRVTPMPTLFYNDQPADGATGNDSSSYVRRFYYWLPG